MCVGEPHTAHTAAAAAAAVSPDGSDSRALAA